MPHAMHDFSHVLNRAAPTGVRINHISRHSYHERHLTVAPTHARMNPYRPHHLFLMNDFNRL